MNKVVVVSAVRTPIGVIGGTLKEIQPEELLKVVFEGAVSKAGIDKSLISEVIAGQAKQSTDQPNIARLSALMADIPEEVPAYTVHRQCASGMQAILSGAQQIQLGYSDIILAGGVESMSTAPFYIRDLRFGIGNGNKEIIDPNTESQPKSQPSDKYGRFTMIDTADRVAQQFGVSREEQDVFALSSQDKAIKAIDSGRFIDEIVPVVIPRRKGASIVFDTDEYPRRDTSLEKMAKLRSINSEGTVTAGNASGRNDGACALLIMSEEKAKEQGLKPLVTIKGGVSVGVDPKIMGISPVFAINKLLDQFQLSAEEIEIFEINEAFAAQSVACVKELGIEPEKVNVNGGAIALGHPLGCSGARITTTAIHELKKRNGRYAIASLCVAGGLGMALLIENESFNE